MNRHQPRIPTSSVLGVCQLTPTDWTGRDHIHGYCYSTSALGVSSVDDARSIAKSAKAETGREHVVVELTVIKRVRKIS